MKPRALKKAVAPPQAVERNPMKTENVCEHGDHPAPEGKRFCSKACRLCESVDGPPCSLECAKEQLAEARAELERLKGALEAVRDAETPKGGGVIGGHIGEEVEEMPPDRCDRREECITCIVLDALSPEPKEGSKP